MEGKEVFYMGKRVLIVDDERSVLNVFRSLLEDEPYSLFFAETGMEVRYYLQKEEFDLIILDKNLPDISGMELLKEIKERYPLTEVIIITGYASLETVLKSFEFDAFDYILKPIVNIFDMKKKVKRAIEKRGMVLERLKLIEDLKKKNIELESLLEELKRTQESLIQSEKLAGIGTVTSGIAHDLGTPVFAIMGIAEAIKRETDNQKIKEYSDEIIKDAGIIRGIIRDLTFFSRMPDSKDLEYVNLRKSFENSVRIVTRTSTLDHIKIENLIDEGLNLLSREQEICQVFVNLLKNSIDSFDSVIKRSPRITVEGISDSSNIVINFSDNGCGIPSEMLGDIFKPFVTSKNRKKGLGLGLNIVYRIVTKYRGSINVNSIEGEGTSFIIKFPLLESDENPL